MAITAASELFRLSEQLKYWKGEYDGARRQFDGKRMLEARRFIRQCNQIIDELEQCVFPAPPAGSDDAKYSSFFS
jgi:hypothetical protein